MLDPDIERTQPIVRAASVDALIQQLVLQSPDSFMPRAFFLTYRAFISPPELFKKLVAYYSVDFAVRLALSVFAG
jgi:hypothetical protein